MFPCVVNPAEVRSKRDCGTSDIFFRRRRSLGGPYGIAIALSNGDLDQSRRRFTNYIWMNEKETKETKETMRFGLAKGPVRFEDIIYRMPRNS